MDPTHEPRSQRITTTTRSENDDTLFLVLPLVSCSDDGEPLAPGERPFLQSTEDNPPIGLVENSTGRALTLFQPGAPDERRQVPLEASSSVTPVGLPVHGPQ
jgi:hypothetical protein